MYASFQLFSSSYCTALLTIPGRVQSMRLHVTCELLFRDFMWLKASCSALKAAFCLVDGFLVSACGCPFAYASEAANTSILLDDSLICTFWSPTILLSSSVLCVLPKGDIFSIVFISSSSPKTLCLMLYWISHVSSSLLFPSSSSNDTRCKSLARVNLWPEYSGEQFKCVHKIPTSRTLFLDRRLLTICSSVSKTVALTYRTVSFCFSVLLVLR